MAIVKIGWGNWVEADEVSSLSWSNYSRCPEVHMRNGKIWYALDFRTDILTPTFEEIGTLMQECVDEIEKHKTRNGTATSVYYSNPS